ncbi:GTPase Era [Gloeobacter kilaueensis]|uniref:GTPase Era n=1 Tax=Gloeobacter kilaueensis (strain ATCC BAA-2537 / CCAP 1431/1 / ULC 316 / JS1) TaxID=1183438 RepID=U5QLB4_GLOK1|nr:GTPase Era [Gloeobacter kilaueensis]AGY58455.1 GTP-binding protein Era [Gloeobacter kilaueensis JS1]
MILPEAPPDFRSGFVAILGRPNVGKSTLVNRLVGEKVAITAPTAQTTRNRLRGILTLPTAQIVLVDTPGIHKPQHRLGEVLVHNARRAAASADGILFLVDGSVEAGSGDRFIAESLKGLPTPLWLVLNKIDQRSARRADLIRESYRTLFDPPVELREVSALKGTGIESLLADVINRLPRGPYYYPPELFTDQPERFIMGELVREQVLLATREEIPHSVAVVIERVEEGEQLTRVLATILVERDSQKGILIGKEGQMLKSIGTKARTQMQKLVGHKVFLQLFVKVKERWRQSDATLKDLGYRRED